MSTTGTTGATSTTSTGSTSGTTGASCSSDADCGGSTLACDTDATPDGGLCVECLLNPDCPGGEACDEAAMTCNATDVCVYAENTTPTTTIDAKGCRVLDRDTESCRSAREALGLSGPWLRFSCLVDLSTTTDPRSGTTFVVMNSQGTPDYHTVYYDNYADAGLSAACHESDNTITFPDPYSLELQDVNMDVTEAPATYQDAGPVAAGLIGLAVNGVAIFNDSAGPNRSISTESGSFDRCGGHPNSGYMYHYHEEPYAITQEDDNLVAVMRDGYFVYGRKDPDGTEPGLPDSGLTAPYYGHYGYTVDSPTVKVFHYHVHWEAVDDGGYGFFVAPQQFFGTMGRCTNTLSDGGVVSSGC